MEGFKNINTLPAVAIAQVSAYDIVNHAIFVTLISGQQISESIRVLYNGNADALRINQEPLPLIGTWGLIAIPNGDIRGALWLGAFYPSAQNAITTSVPPTGNDTQTKYYSHWSGAYWIIDPEGQFYFWLPDGTNFLVNAKNTAPILYRHIINSNNQQQTIAFSNSDRNPTPPNPYYATFTHASGASVGIDNTGAIIAKSANNSGTTVEIDSGGNIHATGSGNAAATINMPGGVVIESANAVELISGSASLQVTQGQIIANPPIISTISPQLSSITP